MPQLEVLAQGEKAVIGGEKGSKRAYFLKNVTSPGVDGKRFKVYQIWGKSPGHILGYRITKVAMTAPTIKNPKETPTTTPLTNDSAKAVIPALLYIK